MGGVDADQARLPAASHQKGGLYCLFANNHQTILTGLFIAAGTQLPVASDLPKLMRSFDREISLYLRSRVTLTEPLHHGPRVCGVISRCTWFVMSM